jgi:hypothetical protein
MAARMRKTHQDEVRTKIQTSQLLNRLQNHALSLTEDELTPTQMKAIEILLRKSLPDLVAVDLHGEVDVGVTVQIVRMGDVPEQ